MRAGSMREHLTFLELQEVQTESGAMKKGWIEKYRCRGYIKRSSPVYDKDDVEAKELFQGITIYIIVRSTRNIHERMRVRHNEFLYDVKLVKPNHNDHTLDLQLKRVNE